MFKKVICVKHNLGDSILLEGDEIEGIISAIVLTKISGVTYHIEYETDGELSIHSINQKEMHLLNEEPINNNDGYFVMNSN